jgi:hypothetical protein
MKIGLDTTINTVLYMFRTSQEDLTISIADNLVKKELPDRLTQFLQAIKSKPMIRRYEFASEQSMCIWSPRILNVPTDVLRPP